jgi:hypothetical protein
VLLINEIVNEGHALPLDASTLKHVALVGPFAEGEAAQRAMLGGYSPGTPSGGVATIAQALSERGGFTVDVQLGCGAGVGGPSTSEADFDKAVAAAAAADVTIVALGTTSCSCCQQCGNGEVRAAHTQSSTARQCRACACCGRRGIVRTAHGLSPRLACRRRGHSSICSDSIRGSHALCSSHAY